MSSSTSFFCKGCEQRDERIRELEAAISEAAVKLVDAFDTKPAKRLHLHLLSSYNEESD